MNAFAHCPRCGSDAFKPSGSNSRKCGSCEFVYYFNPAIAVAAVIQNAREEILLIERARDPGAGLYGLPGGFVERGETAEVALKREAHEELGVELENLRFLLTATNSYHFQGVTYSVLDICYAASCKDFEIRPDRSEVAHYQLFQKSQLPLDRFAFASNRIAVETFLKD